MEVKYGKSCDFRLVSTYLPFATTILRAQVFVFAAWMGGVPIAAHVYAAGLLLAVYFDSLLFRGVCSSCIGGHLLPICFVWLTQPAAGNVGIDNSVDAQVAVNVLWVAAVHALLASYTFRRKFPATAMPILASNAAFVLVRLWLAGARSSALEMHVRSAVFYVFVYTHFYVFQTRSQWDAATHACIGPHVCMHVFFVDRWVLGASLGCTLFMCARVYMQNKAHHDTDDRMHARVDDRMYAPERRTLVDMPADANAEDMAELMQQLLAAKAGAGVAAMEV